MEYGGYLPLELKRGKEYHNVKEKHCRRYNSGRTAIFDTLRYIRPKTVWVPHYICETVMDAIERAGCSYRRYFIEDDFTIKNREDLTIEANDCLILVNYFGLCEKAVLKLAEEYANTNVILDHTQAFFAQPVYYNHVYNIYSCRKFIGTADGAYVIGKEVSDTCLEEDYSAERSLFLLTSIERGTNYSYEQSKQNEVFLKNPLGMSQLTKRILQAADYRYIMRRRRENYEFLSTELGEYNELNLVLEHQVPYCFPFLFRKEIRQDLIKEKIYIPILWQELLKEEYKGSREWKLSHDMLCIPIDQRYSKQDMTKIVEIIKKKVN